MITLKEDEMHSERNTNHHRRSIRLKGYDYAQAGLYFITICVQDRVPLFGEIIDGKMALNTFGHIAWEEWLATEKIRDNIALHEFIIMPDHIHGIIEIKFQKKDSHSEIGKFKSPSQTIGAVIRGFKIATIKKIKDKILNPENREDLDSDSDTGELDSFSSTGDLKIAPTSELDSFSSTGDLKIAPTSELDSFSSTGDLKIAPTKKIIQLNFKIWQRNYYEHIIRNEPSYFRITEYIMNNPAKWTKNKSKTK
ncbi:MAG: transposase [Bacteroidia bacterium]|nr:transposase [Bacteroidia bacterium]